MNEKEIEKRFRADFKQLFPNLKGAILLPAVGLSKGSFKAGRSVDIMLRLKVGNKSKMLLCEVISQRFPKQLREKGLQLLEITEQGGKGYPVIIAPYISELGRETCKKIKVGFLDLSGNAYIDFESFYLEIVGKTNKFKFPSELTGLFNPKAERILRFYLLRDSQREEAANSYRDIAKEVGVSLGQLSKVKKKLEGLGLWTEESRDLKTLDKTKLLDLWRENYRLERNKMFSFYSIMQVHQIEKEFAGFCKTNRIQYAFTLFSGGNRLAPFTRYNAATSYFSGDIEQLKKDLELKEVPSGANFQILVPYDEGVYYRAQEVDSLTIANPIQIYIDLYNYGGRGREQAEFLRERIIKF